MNKLEKLLTTIAAWCFRIRVRWIKNIQIAAFSRYYGVNLAEAAYSNAKDYSDFESFFIRRLNPQARPIKIFNDVAGNLANAKSHIISPVDGFISIQGKIEQNTVFQAKGQALTIHELLAQDDESMLAFEGGHYSTIYLAPKNYHRVHMPSSGLLRSVSYIPGRLRSVKMRNMLAIPRLLAENERVVCQFEGVKREVDSGHLTDENGQFAVIFVGALIVGGIHLSSIGKVSALKQGESWTIGYNEKTTTRDELGSELGYFSMGSTVIILFSSHYAPLPPIVSDACPVYMGERLSVKS